MGAKRVSTTIARLSASREGALEPIALDPSLNTLEAVRHLPSDRRTIVPGDCLPEIMQDVSTWGEILLVVHTADLILEWPTVLPPGTFARGYFNFPGESRMGGNIRAENCLHIAFVRRPFLDQTSCSVQFFNGFGDVMFKIFVRRDAQRRLIGRQVEKFEALCARCCRGPACPALAAAEEEPGCTLP